MSDKKVELYDYDTAEYLTDDEMILGYLNEVIKENDPKLFAQALGDIARAKQMNFIASKTGLNKENLYKALSKNGNPTITTVMKIMSALNIKFVVEKEIKSTKITV
jgi:probable addiction module antidote protein